MRRILLPFMFILILTFETLNTQLCAGIESTSCVAIDPSESIREVKTKQNNSSEVYRDGIVDNFDNFTNPGFPTEYNRFRFLPVSCRIIEVHVNCY